MTPLEIEVILDEITANPHLDLVALGRRGFKWEIVKQLIEEYWTLADLMEEVKGARQQTFPKTRMVLQFQQGPHFYRLAFDLYLKLKTPMKRTYRAVVMTMFHDGISPGLECDVYKLDGTYDLPTENIR